MNDDILLTTGDASNKAAIRAALQRQADRAPDAAPILDALRGRTARAPRSRRRWVAVGAALFAGVATVAVGFAAGPFLGSGSRQGAMPAAGGSLLPRTIPLQFKPTWVPPEYRDSQPFLRMDFNDGQFSPTWFYDSKDGRSLLSIALADRVGPSPAPHDLFARIGQGKYVAVNVMGAEPGQQVLQRIADAVRPDDGVYEVPIRAGWLPGIPAHPRRNIKSTDGKIAIEYPAEKARPDAVEYSARGTGSAELKTVRTTIGLVDKPLPTVAESLTVGGHPARYGTGVNPELDVLIAPHQLLTVVGNPHSGADPDQVGSLSKADAIRVAESVQLSDHPIGLTEPTATS
jgi:hypothetical protein